MYSSIMNFNQFDEKLDIIGVTWMTHEDLPVLVATEDFFEFLAEQGYEGTMEAGELFFELKDYVRTECERI